ncbi:hypothetical protein HKCCE3408_19090 [Rhodobacterales bacterium HKCCE3408]|nr:hypothetical protein [Rhodobacterales bacterium HKCCE3408]
MQTTLPMIFLPVSPVERPRDLPEIRPAAGAEDAAMDADGQASAETASRAEALARAAMDRIAGPPALGFPPLDTRVVGDADIIDPDRPTARIPDPIVSLEELRGGQGDAGTEPPEPPRDPLPAIPPEPAADTDRTPAPDRTEAPPIPAGPPSPKAKAADVPDPPPPGSIDLRA